MTATRSLRPGIAMVSPPPARRASLPSFRRSLLARSIIRTDELLGLKDKVGSSLAALLVRLGVSHSARDCGQKEGLKGEGEGEGEGGAPCVRAPEEEGEWRTRKKNKRGASLELQR